MKTTHGEFKISPEALAVLKASKVTDGPIWVLQLPPRQLDRKLYQEVNKVLETAGGTWVRRNKVHLFASDPRAKLGLAVETGKALDEKKHFQRYYTPAALADRVACMADLRPHYWLLEPSAGEGALVDAAQRACGIPLANVIAVELDPEAAAKLKAKGLRVIEGDFLKCTPPPVWFDRIIMNPPFAKGADIDHVTRAFSLLKPGGILVAIMSAGTVQGGRTKKQRAFLDLMLKASRGLHTVPAGAFHESGTEVRTVIVKLEKEA